MAIVRMDNVLIVVDNLDAAKTFFLELGMELEGQTRVEGPWVDRILGLDNVRSDIVLLRTPDGHGKVELSKFHHPPALGDGTKRTPINTLGMRRIMFTVDDVDAVVAHMQRHGGHLVGEITQYEDLYRLCFIRGPEGIVVGLAEELG